MTRVLHIWNVAGIAGEPAHFANPKQRVITRRAFDQADHFLVVDTVCPTAIPFYEIDAHSNPNPLVNKADIAWFYANCIIRQYWGDLLHIHGSVEIVCRLRWFLCTSYILHYRGADVRDTPRAERRTSEAGAEAIIVATPDLLEYEFDNDPVYLPNIVNTDMFAPRAVPCNGRGLVHMTNRYDEFRPIKRLNDMGHGDIDWECRPYPVADKAKRVMYKNMPEHLARYEYYGDMAYHAASSEWYHAGSKTALEAMSLGVRHDRSVRDTLPSRHRPENVMPKLRAVYRNAGVQET